MVEQSIPESWPGPRSKVRIYSGNDTTEGIVRKSKASEHAMTGGECEFKACPACRHGRDVGETWDAAGSASNHSEPWKKGLSFCDQPLAVENCPCHAPCVAGDARERLDCITAFGQRYYASCITYRQGERRCEAFEAGPSAPPPEPREASGRRAPRCCLPCQGQRHNPAT